MSEKSKQQTTDYIPIKELYAVFPVIQNKGWDEAFIQSLVENDIILGHFNEKEPNTVMVSQRSMEGFLDYHKNYLLDRIKESEEGKIALLAKAKARRQG